MPDSLSMLAGVLIGVTTGVEAFSARHVVHPAARIWHLPRLSLAAALIVGIALAGALLFAMGTGQLVQRLTNGDTPKRSVTLIIAGTLWVSVAAMRLCRRRAAHVQR